MRKTKVIINYSDLSTPHFLEFGRNTVVKMEANQLVFPSPDVPLSTMTESLTLLEIRYLAAKSGGKQQTLELNITRKDSEEFIRKQGLYVDRVADGDETIIMKSGFDMTRPPLQSVKPIFVAENGEHAGEVDLHHKSIPGSKSWVWQKCADPLDDSKWEPEAITTQASYTVKGLPSVSRYWFRAAYITIDGQSDWTAAIDCVVH
jgi:hypothetical protein